jgi:cytochrome c oxidase subunit II
VQAFKVGLFAVVLGAIGAVLVVVSPSWFPVAASQQADRVDTIYMALMIMSSFIFAIVVSFLGYSMWKFRAKPGDMSDGPHIEGNTTLEIVWTIIPLVIVLGFAVWGAIAVSKNEQTSNDMLVVHAVGREFAWDFRYPQQQNITPIIPEIPVGQKVEFKIYGVPNDVIHEFYIPAFRVGIDAVPGTPTSIIVDPTKVGVYNIICNMLCGIGHSQMRTVINVVSKQDFDKWVTQQEYLKKHPPKPKAPTSSNGAVDAKAVFASAGCAGCHTLAAAGATGKIGPSLDNITADAAKYGKGETPEQYVQESIDDPNKVIVSGFQPGVMPESFAQSLSKAEIDALVKLITNGSSSS